MPKDNRPCILFFHGGAWTAHDLDTFKDYADHFASLGYVCFRVDYRAVTDAEGLTPYDAVQDGKDAYAWVHLRAGEYGIDRQKIIVCGASAGTQVSYYAGAPYIIMLGPALNMEQRLDLMLGLDPVPISPYYTIQTDQLVPTMIYTPGVDGYWRVQENIAFAQTIIDRGGSIDAYFIPEAPHECPVLEPWKTDIMQKMEIFLSDHVLMM